MKWYVLSVDYCSESERQYKLFQTRQNYHFVCKYGFMRYFTRHVL